MFKQGVASCNRLQWYHCSPEPPSSPCTHNSMCRPPENLQEHFPACCSPDPLLSSCTPTSFHRPGAARGAGLCSHRCLLSQCTACCCVPDPLSSPCTHTSMRRPGATRAVGLGAHRCLLRQCTTCWNLRAHIADARSTKYCAVCCYCCGVPDPALPSCLPLLPRRPGAARGA